MGEPKNKDEVVGRVKEATGALLDDEELRNEGRIDQAAGVIKQKANEAIDKLRDAIGGDDADEAGADRD